MTIDQHLGELAATIDVLRARLNAELGRTLKWSSEKTRHETLAILTAHATEVSKKYAALLQHQINAEAYHGNLHTNPPLLSL